MAQKATEANADAQHDDLSELFGRDATGGTFLISDAWDAKRPDTTITEHQETGGSNRVVERDDTHPLGETQDTEAGEIRAEWFPE